MSSETVNGDVFSTPVRVTMSHSIPLPVSGSGVVIFHCRKVRRERLGVIGIGLPHIYASTKVVAAISMDSASRCCGAPSMGIVDHCPLLIRVDFPCDI